MFKSIIQFLSFQNDDDYKVGLGFLNKQEMARTESVEVFEDKAEAVSNWLKLVN